MSQFQLATQVFRKPYQPSVIVFFWPGVCSDVKNYITSCHLCKTKSRPGRDRPAPFQHNRIRKDWRIAQESETFIVRSDASDFGIGAVLLQDRDGTLMLCRYASRKVLPRECRYSAIEREALALVFAVTQFQRYLNFKHFVLQTDHKPLAYLRTGSPKNARLMKWALVLQEFSFQVVHIPGSENVHADVLSRLC
ncbi:retrovirus-related pol polyprotein from transposon 17.6 [Plakobranchus ocellatus]|uniref:Retrovirus-related pol polyprotein from transposon 17.6 n=1 Tax=Plakobranchus ocellatus TaxID=259542 RepID=A0AAV4DD88_9GAST|nr:retrovirus-related pol polyprotein from transposon 17.6 [Plakobranchus ocellatus]